MLKKGFIIFCGSNAVERASITSIEIRITMTTGQVFPRDFINTNMCIETSQLVVSFDSLSAEQHLPHSQNVLEVSRRK